MNSYVVVIVHNRLQNVERWLKCWKECDYNGFKLVIVQNHNEPQPQFEDLCYQYRTRYIRRSNVGYDIGVFQDICNEKLVGFDNDWDKLMIVSDDWIPMRKSFLNEFVNAYDNGNNQVVVTEISNIYKRHIRTSGFMLSKNVSVKLNFDTNQIISKDDCYNFEHRSSNAFYEQCLNLGVTPIVVSELNDAPLWDTEHHASLNRIEEHNKHFDSIKKNNAMKIILFGGSGLLGSKLLSINPDLISPTSSEVNVENSNSVSDFIKQHKPDLVINCSAQTDNRKIEKNTSKAIQTNIIGSANISLACIENKARLVYISTDYIYKGDRGNYKETDEILPFNFYAWSKLGGETSAMGVDNHLIIRTSFGDDNFTYKTAFNDKYTSKDYVDVIAPMIYEASISSLIGIINIGTDRKTLYDYASKKSEVQGVSVSETYHSTPIDTSLNLQRWINYKSNNSICKPHTHCRCCGSANMTKYLDLGVMPLANNLETTSKSAKEKERYPLQIMFCNDCALSQLSVVINPSKMFSYYTYRSSINGGYVSHCNDMAWEVSERYKLDNNSFVIDIAGNDGALLLEFKKIFKPKVLNVDPATNLTAIAEQRGIESLTKFWCFETSMEVICKYGKANLITATNVFAHNDDMFDFLHSAKNALTESGVLLIEFPYIVDFINNKEYDTTYFEHLSYIAVTPIYNLCKSIGLEIFDVEKHKIHGGSVRLSISHTHAYEKNLSVDNFLNLEKENGFLDLKKYIQWADDIEHTIKDFSEKLLNLKLEGKTISGFGASAKGNTLLNSCRINTDIIDYIADETPEKIGKFSPTTGIPIVNKQTIIDKPTDYIVILAWNFQEEIIKKLRQIYLGKFIIPVPEFKIIEYTNKID